MTLFPAFLKLANRPVLVVGGGSIATSKIPAFLGAGAQVTVVSPNLSAALTQLHRNHEFVWFPKLFEPADLDGKFLVIAATSLPALNASVFRAADERQILCNAVDDIDHCHFYYGAIVQRGDLQIAISTNGKSPALAQRLRKELEQQFGPEYAPWLDHLGRLRQQLRATSTDPESTKGQLHYQASHSAFTHFVHHLTTTPSVKKTSFRARRAGERGTPLRSTPGTTRVPHMPPLHVGSWVTSYETPNSQLSIPDSPRVFLLGAGPGDPELLTVKALRVLQSANIVIHDSLVSPEILALIPPTAQRIDVGKRRGFRLLSQSEINSLLVDAAHRHEIIVRLKGGDPLLFGRAAEEIDALRAASVPFEIIPGISAAFASAAAAQVSLTDRRVASHVLFTTYSRSPETKVLPILGITSETTVVVYMPGPDYSGVSHWLLESGIVAESPCLVISKASQPDQAARTTTLSRLASLPPLPAPALLIVGRVVAQSSDAASTLSWLLDARQDAVQGNLIS